MKPEAIYKLFRLKPTVAWTLSGILLGTSVAIHEYGWGLHWKLLLYVLLAAAIIQGILAHAINDLIDEEVDKKTDMKGTNRAKVLLLGLASRTDLLALVIVSLAVTLGVAVRIYIELGLLVIAFYAIGLYAPIAYSLPPLKLGWRPFSEWTVVFPVLITLVVATNFVATGKLSWLAFFTGTVFALFNVLWFLTSRLMDYEPDKNTGKVTTAVYLGLDYMPFKGYSDFFCYTNQYMAIISILLFWYLLAIIIFFNSVFFVSSVIWFYMSEHIPRYSESRNPVVLSMHRTFGILTSILNSVALSIVFILF